MDSQYLRPLSNLPFSKTAVKTTKPVANRKNDGRTDANRKNDALTVVKRKNDYFEKMKEEIENLKKTIESSKYY